MVILGSSAPFGLRWEVHVDRFVTGAMVCLQGMFKLSGRHRGHSQHSWGTTGDAHEHGA